MNVLFVKNNGLGDSAVSLPSIISFKNEVPKTNIFALTNSTGMQLYRGLFDEIIDVDEASKWGLLKVIFTLRKKKIDIALVTSDTSSRLIAALWLGGVNKLIGFSNPKLAFLFDEVLQFLPNYHHGRLNHKLMKAIGVRAGYDEFYGMCLFPVKEEYQHVNALLSNVGLSKQSFISIHPGGNRESRRWQKSKFIELIKRLSADGEKVVLVGNRDEYDLCEEILHLCGAGDNYNLCGILNIPELAYVIAASKAFIGHSSGPLHLAYLQGVTSISLWGAASEEIWGPLNTGKHKLIRAKLACAPCELPNCSETEKMKCMQQISVDYVYREVSRYLNCVGISTEEATISS